MGEPPKVGNSQIVQTMGKTVVIRGRRGIEGPLSVLLVTPFIRKIAVTTGVIDSTASDGRPARGVKGLSGEGGPQISWTSRVWRLRGALPGRPCTGGAPPGTESLPCPSLWMGGDHGLRSSPARTKSLICNLFL